MTGHSFYDPPLVPMRWTGLSNQQTTQKNHETEVDMKQVQGAAPLLGVQHLYLDVKAAKSQFSTVL